MKKIIEKHLQNLQNLDEKSFCEYFANEKNNTPDIHRILGITYEPTPKQRVYAAQLLFNSYYSMLKNLLKNTKK